jgi:hypothetical protein
MIAWGVLLIVTSAIGIPKARAAQRLMGGARPLVAPAYLQREQALIVEGRQALEQLTTTALPRLADRLHVSGSDLQAELSSHYPRVAAGLTMIPTIFDTTAASLSNLQNHHADFQDADTFPAAHVSRLAESIGAIVFGGLLAGLGIVVLLRNARWPVATSLVLTVLAAVVPLAFWLPGKAQGVEDMAASLHLTKQTAVATRASYETIAAFTAELEQHLIPDAAAQAGTSPEALTADLENGLVELQAAIRHYPTVARLFTPDVELRETAYPDFQSVKDVPVLALTWTFIAVNALVAAVAAGALLAGRARRSG